MTIFVSIAAYRDPELIPTILDCLATASKPNDIHIAVWWQHGPEENISSTPVAKQIRLLDVDWRESKGVCWARAEIMKLWSGEKYYLQIDSHHRFVPDWDVHLIRQLQLAESSKPIITTYCQNYEPGVQPLLPGTTKMVLDYFTSDGIPMYRAEAVDASAAPRRPLRSRFVSAHFLFASASFIQEVEYDPAIYFHGEEITLAVRAYTWGYDFFHPSATIMWHQYSREGRAKHWSDHTEANAMKVPWHQRDRASRARVVELLKNPSVGRFACGPSRTVDQYQSYAGIDFRRQMVQNHTLLGNEPPNLADAAWQPILHNRQVTIGLERHELHDTRLANAQFWRVSLRDPADVQVHQVDLQREVLEGILADDSPLVLIRLTIDSFRNPNRWVIQSHNEQGRETYQVSGPLRTPPVT